MADKLYCYVDESGQDTEGRFFVVVAIILAGDQVELATRWEQIENLSGKGKVKWHKSRSSYRRRYLELIAAEQQLRSALYSKAYRDAGRAYQELTTLAIAQAITAYCYRRQIADYSMTIVVDGLNRSVCPALASNLRRLGIRTRKVRGTRDESDAAIRLADAVAGLVRGAEEGDADLRLLHTLLTDADLLRET